MAFVRHVNLRVPAGAARPGPAIGQALGPLGINMAEFCKQFNEATESTYEKETPLQVQLSALSDRTFTFAVRTPPTSYLIKKAAGVTKGPESVNPEVPIGYITPEAVYEIAKIKHAGKFEMIMCGQLERSRTSPLNHNALDLLFLFLYQTT
jgi:large subunit ribosomal protein L11